MSDRVCVTGNRRRKTIEVMAGNTPRTTCSLPHTTVPCAGLGIVVLHALAVEGFLACVLPEDQVCERWCGSNAVLSYAF
jgi:hypothetical protein